MYLGDVRQVSPMSKGGFSIKDSFGEADISEEYIIRAKELLARD